MELFRSPLRHEGTWKVHGCLTFHVSGPLRCLFSGPWDLWEDRNPVLCLAAVLTAVHSVPQRPWPYIKVVPKVPSITDFFLNESVIVNVVF